MKVGLPWMKNGIKSLAKSLLTLLGLTAEASAEIHKKVIGSGTILLIISKKEMCNSMKKLLAQEQCCW